MDPLRIAYEKTALHRLGIPFERAIELQSVRIALAGSVKRVLPPPAIPAARRAAG